VVKSFQFASVCAVFLTFSLFLQSCKTQHECKEGSVFIKLSCDSAPVGVDEIVLSVSDSRGSDMHVFSSCADKPSLEVNLSKYTQGEVLKAVVVFKIGGKEITRSIERPITLKPTCTSFDFAIAADEVEMIASQPTRPEVDGSTTEDDAGNTMPPLTDGGTPSDGSTNGLGSSCNSNEDCATGAFCVSKVCCNTECKGACESCLKSQTGGDDGFCKAVSVGKDPKQSCAAKQAEPCGPVGSCDGQGQCSLAAPGTSCGNAACGGAGQVVAGSTCDGKGKCNAGVASGCGGYACKGGNCSDTCANDLECVGVKCINGKCGGKRGLGEACGGAAECGSGNCVANVCCDSACGESCKSCKGAVTGQKDGTCAFVKAGEDPGNSCAADATNICGNDGTCDGAGGCRKMNASANCGAAVCAGQTYSAVRNCDGAGNCKVAVTSNCDVYACTAGGCKKPCGADGDCVAGHYCASGVCVPAKPNGSACSTSAQCSTGFCAPEGICCNESCNGTCKQCLSGTCLAVRQKADPDSCPASVGICDDMSRCLKNDGQPCDPVTNLCSSRSCTTFTIDADGDGYGSGAAGAATMSLCGRYGNGVYDPPGYGRPFDCCDADASTGPQYDDAGKPNDYSYVGDNCGQFDLNCDGKIEELSTECSISCPSGSSIPPLECIIYKGEKGCGKPATRYLCYYSLMSGQASSQACR
jgi:hypothetical protein